MDCGRTDWRSLLPYKQPTRAHASHAECIIRVLLWQATDAARRIEIIDNYRLRNNNNNNNNNKGALVVRQYTEMSSSAVQRIKHAIKQ